MSRSRWLVTVLLPGSDKMSKYTVQGGDAVALLDLLSQLRARAERRVASPVAIVTIQEAGFDGFWIHRTLQANGIESHVVEAASIAVPRRHRRAKTDALDGEALLRTLMAFKRGEPRVCSMVVPPSPEEEDRRRVSRERRTLIRNASATSTASKGCWLPRGSVTTNRCARTVALASRNCGPGMIAELWPKLGDGGLRKAAYRGG
jgi:transposase